jgi:hypothetical protein
MSVHELRFSQRHVYDSLTDGITVPVTLKTGSCVIELLAKIDTGASDCLFERGYAEALGLQLENGERKTYATANSRFEAYGHEILIEVMGIETHTLAYFFADPHITRNVLGRRGCPDRIRLGIVDYDQAIYLGGLEE